MPPRNRNRIQNRADFGRTVDELASSGALERAREIVLLGSFKDSWEEFAELLDLMKRQMHFGREQVLLQAICTAFFLLGQGKLDKDMEWLDYQEEHKKEAS